MPRIRNSRRTRQAKADSKSSSLNADTRGEPLQDIQGASAESPADEAILGSKRRVRAPRRKKFAYEAVHASPDPLTEVKKTPSSLPPSSPPSHIANFLPIATSEDAPFHMQERKLFHDQENLEVGEDLDFDSEVYRMQEEGEGAGQGFDFSASGSDPFGFFALENKLKAERLQRPPPTEAKVAPVPISSRPPKVPRTPHKQRIGKRPVSPSREGPSSDTQGASLTSSPSPTKGAVARRSSTQITEEVNLDAAKETSEEEEDDGELVEKHSKTRAKRRKRREVNSSDSPERLAKNLKALLPRRRAKRSSRLGGGKAKKILDDDDDDDNTGTETEKKKNKFRARGRVKANKHVEEHIDVDADERVRERQARIEYFKKLEGYKMEKENVYVI